VSVVDKVSGEIFDATSVNCTSPSDKIAFNGWRLTDSTGGDSRIRNKMLRLLMVKPHQKYAELFICAGALGGS